MFCYSVSCGFLKLIFSYLFELRIIKLFSFSDIWFFGDLLSKLTRFLDVILFKSFEISEINEIFWFWDFSDDMLTKEYSSDSYSLF